VVAVVLVVQVVLVQVLKGQLQEQVAMVELVFR
jgi:hypothetical protein